MAPQSSWGASPWAFCCPGPFLSCWHRPTKRPVILIKSIGWTKKYPNISTKCCNHHHQVLLCFVMFLLGFWRLIFLRGPWPSPGFASKRRCAKTTGVGAPDAESVVQKAKVCLSRCGPLIFESHEYVNVAQILTMFLGMGEAIDTVDTTVFAVFWRQTSFHRVTRVIPSYQVYIFEPLVKIFELYKYNIYIYIYIYVEDVKNPPGDPTSCSVAPKSSWTSRSNTTWNCTLSFMTTKIVWFQLKKWKWSTRSEVNQFLFVFLWTRGFLGVFLSISRMTWPSTTGWLWHRPPAARSIDQCRSDGFQTFRFNNLWLYKWKYRNVGFNISSYDSLDFFFRFRKMIFIEETVHKRYKSQCTWPESGLLGHGSRCEALGRLWHWCEFTLGTQGGAGG